MPYDRLIVPGAGESADELERLRAENRWLRSLLGEEVPLYGAVPRSPGWDHVRDEAVRLHPWCAACGGRKALEVHHKRPFHLDHALELDPVNLIVLCRVCHLLFGHLLSWSSFNADVERDAEWFLNKVRHRP